MPLGRRSRHAIALVEALGRTVAVCTVILPMADPQSANNTGPEKGSLAWYAAQAQQSGKNAITLGRPDILVAEPESFTEAIQHTSAVVAQLLATETTHDDYQVITWRKYRVLEVLSRQQRSVPHDPLPSDVPQSLVPVAPGEFITAEPGGTVVVGGVRITVPEPEGSIPVGQSRHLIFALFRSSGAIGVSNYGARGVFWIDSSDVIHSRVDPEKNRLASEIAHRTNGNLSALRTFVASVPKQ